MFSCLIVGCGRVAGALDSPNMIGARGLKSHSSCFYSHENINIKGYVDVDLDAAKAMASKYAVSYYSNNVEEALKDVRPSFISVCTPDASHFEVMSKVLLSPFCPRVIFLEKPALTSSTDFSTIAELSKNVDTTIIVNHSRRFDDNYKALKDIIVNRTYGECIRIDCWYYSGWIHNGVHLVDTLQHIFDDELVLKSTGSWNTAVVGSSDINLEGVFSLKKSGINVFVNCMDESNYQLFELDFKFTKGRVRIENFEERFLVEEVFVNELGEKVLNFKSLPSISKLKSADRNEPIMNAANVIVDTLECGSSHPEYTIHAAEATMKTIWSTQEKVLK